MLRRAAVRRNTMSLWQSALRKRRGRRPISLNRLPSHLSSSGCTNGRANQGTFTAGNGPVGCGAKCGCPRTVAEIATKAIMMIASPRIP
jgi:hypothetical protein